MILYFDSIFDEYRWRTSEQTLETVVKQDLTFQFAKSTPGWWL